MYAAIGGTEAMQKQKVFVACENPDTPVERAFVVAGHLMNGEGLTIEQVMEMTGLGANAAYDLLCKGSRVLPLRVADGIWEIAIFAETQF